MSDCIEVTTARTSAGYGTTAVNVGGREYHVLAHRMAYEVEHGSIPEGMLVCHTCDNRACVNIAHLFLGTHSDNLSDSYSKGRVGKTYAPKTHCKKGHEYDEENTGTTSVGGRYCRACNRRAGRAA